MRTLVIFFSIVLFALIIVKAGLWLIPPKPPFVYHYQWPGAFGDQRTTICIGVAEDHDECPRDYISSEL